MLWWAPQAGRNEQWQHRECSRQQHRGQSSRNSVLSPCVGWRIGTSSLSCGSRRSSRSCYSSSWPGQMATLGMWGVEDSVIVLLKRPMVALPWFPHNWKTRPVCKNRVECLFSSSYGSYQGKLGDGKNAQHIWSMLWKPTCPLHLCHDGGVRSEVWEASTIFS